jgi:hypothetical protein
MFLEDHMRVIAASRVPTFVTLLSVFLMGGMLVPASTGDAAAQTTPTGRPIPRAQGKRVDPHQIEPLSPTGDVPQQIKEAPRHFPVNQAAYARLKGQADAAAAGRDNGGQGSLTVAPTPQFATLGSTDTGGWNPPDGALGVGPTSVLTVANEALAMYDRGGNRLLGPLGLVSFFGDPGASSVYDPRALYDAGNASARGYGGGHGRFVVLATDGSNFTLAVSQNESPQSAGATWCTYLVDGVTTNADGSTDWVDYPSLGMDGDYLYLTSNQFSNVDNSFQYARLVILPKASVYPNATTGACPQKAGWDYWNLQNPGGGAAFTVQPANQPDAQPGVGGTMYLVNSIWASGSNLVVRSVTNAPGTAPVPNDATWVSSGFIAPYTLPASAPQPNTSAKVDTGDTRLLGAVYRYGSIFTANTTGTVSASLSASANAYANAQWYQITPTSPATSRGASSAVTNSSVAFFFPRVLPVCAAGPTCSSPKTVLEASVSGRFQTASAASVANGSAAVFGRGVGGYSLSSRWGDYPAVAADPTSPGTAWLFGEYARSTTAWGTATTSVTP